MKQLIDSIQKSIYGPEYYRELLGKPIGASFKYFASLALLLAVFLTIISSIPLVIMASTFAHEFPEKFFAYYPDELQVTVTNGIVSSNVTEPYFLQVPLEWKSALETKEGTLDNVAVIDTATPFSMDQFVAYKTAVWLGKDQVAYRDQNNAVKIQQLGKTANFVLNESLLRTFESMISPYYRFIGPVIVIAIFLALSIGFAVNLLYLLFAALLILILGKVMKIPLAYAKCYQIGLHAVTLPLLIDALLALSSLAFMRMTFAPTIILLVIVYVNLRALSPQTPPAPTVPTLPPA